MSLVLYLENSEGKDTAIQVNPEDDFASFVQRAKDILGYEVDISCITNNQDVPLTDNIYQFLLRAEMNLVGGEQLGDVSIVQDPCAGNMYMEDPGIGHPGIGDFSIENPGINGISMNAESELLYVLEDGSHVSAAANEGNYVLKQEIDGTLSYIMLSEADIAEHTQDFYCDLRDFQIVNDDDGSGRAFPLQLVSQELDFVPQFDEYIQEDQFVDAETAEVILDLHQNNFMIDNSYSEVRLINSNDIETEDNQTIILQASAVMTYDQQDILDIFKEPSFDLGNHTNEVQVMNNCQLPDVSVCLNVSESTNGPKEVTTKTVPLPNKARNMVKGGDSCHICFIPIPDSVHKTFIFDENDQRELLKGSSRKKQNQPKIICGVCLVRDYERQPCVPHILGKDHFLVIRNKIQMTFKKKIRPPNTESLDCVNLKENKSMQVSDESAETSHFVIMGCDSTDFAGSIKQEITNYGETNSQKNISKPDYICRICGMDLQQLAIAVTHCLEHRMPPPAQVACVLCLGGYETFQKLRQHMRTEHSSKKMKLQGSKGSQDDADETQHEKNSQRKPINLNQHSKETERNHSTLESYKNVDNKEKINSSKVKSSNFNNENEYSTSDSTCDDSLEGLGEDKIKKRGARVRVEVFPTPGPPACPRSAVRALKHCLRTAVKVETEEWLNEDTGELFKKENPVYILKDPPSPYSQDQSDSDSDGGVWIVQAGAFPEDPPTPRAFQCPQCLKRYSTAERMSRHNCVAAMGTIHDPDLENQDHDQDGTQSKGAHMCNLCPARFHTKVRLQFHTRHLHPVGSTIPQRCSLRCTLCPNLRFTSEAGLYDHVHFAHPRVRHHICPEPGCDKAFHLKASLTTHARSHAGERTHKCDVCEKTFYDRQTLSEHSVTHLEVKPFQCHICYKFLNRRSRLRMHLRTHASEPVAAFVLSCRCCDRAFGTAAEAEEHVSELGECLEPPEVSSNPDDPGPVLFEEPLIPKMECESTDQNEASTEANKLEELCEVTRKCIKAVEIDKVYRCEYCEKVYCVADSLNVHRECHSGVRTPFKCHVCGAVFTSYSRCTTHKTTHGFYRGQAGRGARASSPLRQDSFPVVKHFLCEVCGKSYLHWTYLQVHRRQKHSDNVHMYTCKFCGDQFPSSWGIAYHRKKMHSQSSSTTNGETAERTIYSCEECGLVMKRPGQLAQHRRNAHGVFDLLLNPQAPTPGVYVCMKCDKRFITKVGYNGHMKSHRAAEGGARPHSCEQCGKSFVHSAGLSTHARRVHMREANFSCTHCAKAFYSACDLQSHLRRHTGERPFPCNVCGHAFRTKGMRNEHLRIHTGERPYPCDICGLAFRRSYALKNHRLIHSGERRHPCAICPRAFRLRADLNGHIRQKHPETIPEQKPELPELLTQEIIEGGGGVIVFDVAGNPPTDASPKLLRGDVEIFTEIFDEDPRGGQFMAGREDSLGLLLLPKDSEDFCRSPDDARRFRELFSSVENN